MVSSSKHLFFPRLFKQVKSFPKDLFLKDTVKSAGLRGVAQTLTNIWKDILRLRTMTKGFVFTLGKGFAPESVVSRDGYLCESHLLFCIFLDWEEGEKGVMPAVAYSTETSRRLLECVGSEQGWNGLNRHSCPTLLQVIFKSLAALCGIFALREENRGRSAGEGRQKKQS